MHLLRGMAQCQILSSQYDKTHSQYFFRVSFQQVQMIRQTNKHCQVGLAKEATKVSFPQLSQQSMLLGWEYSSTTKRPKLPRSSAPSTTSACNHSRHRRLLALRIEVSLPQDVCPKSESTLELHRISRGHLFAGGIDLSLLKP